MKTGKLSFQGSFDIQGKKKFTAEGFHSYLKSVGDACCLTTVFLNSGYPARYSKLSDFVTPQGQVTFKPAGIIFKAGGSTLVD
jgi:hypothetical protein